MSGRIINYQQIFLCIGYIQLNSGLGMVLNIPERNDVTLVCCELLIGIQELNEIDRSGQDLMEYFGLRKPISRENLGTAQSVQPAESGPGQPQRPQPLDRHQHQEPNRTDNVPVSQQTVPTQPPLQRQLSPLQAFAPQQAISVSPRPEEMEMHKPSNIQNLPAPKLSAHKTFTETFPPTNIDRGRQQYGSGQMLPPPNRGSGPIKPTPITQKIPPINIDQRQQYGSGQMPNQGSGPIEPIPITQTIPPTNIDQRQLYGSGPMPPPKQGSGPIEPIPLTHTFPPTNIDQRQLYGSGPMLPPKQGSGTIEPTPIPQTIPPINIDRRQQYGSGQMPNQGSGLIEPIPITQTIPPTNIDQRQLYGSGPMPPPKQGSGPIEPTPLTHTFPPTNIDRRQQYGSGQMPPQNQGSGRIEHTPNTQRFAPTHIEPMQQASGPGQSFQAHGSSHMQANNMESTLQGQMNQQNMSAHPQHYSSDPSLTVNPLESTQIYQSNPGYSRGHDPSIDPSLYSRNQGSNPPYGYGQVDVSQSHQSQNVSYPAAVNPGSFQNPQLNRGQDIPQTGDMNRQHNDPPRTQSGQLYAFQGQHPSYILILEFEKIRTICPNFNLLDQIPQRLVDLARNCLQLSAKDKFSNDLVGEIILTNLKRSIPIIDICQGLEWIAKYCMCIYLRHQHTEVVHLKVCVEYIYF